ncbi:NDP-sugar epimerase, includes UDP-GlcNAc-inverting 4,6-dehydratase FlaA1 and capsular polysaccharide biosynthesis protein EpsC [Roseovarius nanhaiticus]|uniref:NDP-sugar epimerase, includes UDP-GlcNAc-inverting 4,6-dehydratase FlaA1 and capsular polysaccharide biosynthesis protein EpsC n=1 Tax=Roseovarius nanhaiticus TaxID=573024 RepID=A0A1N7EPM5_9RHOB|nr:nucleoside-diphosphate sugar epimerase/dehydratase [Roseovarius nanhaiticus]SEK69801.1 NDP-sugar epimerase, includes UDP-GlcNAc-inverting 4,6-dehydratase FlaA1 and capsular polysaccharide biosynthesis protein EpsC [Roseovarius nanhaiticus]SIR90020.1 NDP-sugar epimerase, includes UDP-GlcNAc-inverting 4,6-dehydratase FlaA1 and capsular polysaccharide biosynthesis protein EpsC [Roseovarius nanhaiticus]
MISEKLHNLPRLAKRAIFLVTDTLLVPISLYAAFALRYGTLTQMDRVQDSLSLFVLMTVLGGVLISICRLPRIKLNALEMRAVTRIGTTAALLALLAITLSYMLDLSGPRSVPIIFCAVFFLASLATRIAALTLLGWLEDRQGTRQRVAIYGAGAGGIQMAAALRQSPEARPVLFIDDNSNLQGLMTAGLPVYASSDLKKLVERHRIQRVLLAIPSISEERRRALIDKLAALGLEVQVLPSYIEMMTGKGAGEPLRPVSPDALLGRDKVDLDTPEIAKAYAGRTVLVTGAGGSIGSELCRQLINRRPKRIVLFEHSEIALYAIDQDMRKRAAGAGVAITTRLGSVTDAARVAAVMSECEVEIVLHAAAYKHVPIVEENELEGARNNVMGTKVVADAAMRAGVERFILVSTDKAVRPTNIMGASKRLAELVVQDLQTRTTRTRFAIVRFGNVLGSSGSVLPLFERQIKQGGPVTVTHPEVTRFFMTIPEAARLVLLAGAYAKGSDVFVLDMGEPQKIIDIARRMVEMSGRTVRDSKTGKGDIEIEITGLRPGEKLYEELLIDDDSLRATPHPKILRAEEASLSEIETSSMLRELEKTLEARDTARLRRLIAARVDGYHIQKEVG